jgi:hypothetical protein
LPSDSGLNIVEIASRHRRSHDARYADDAGRCGAMAARWLVEDALKMHKSAPDDAIVIRPEEKKAA